MDLDVVLSPLLQVVFDKLATPFLEEITNICGLKKDLKKLRRTLRVIQSVLKDAEERQLTDRALRIWLTELKEVAYDVEDLLDECSLEVMLSGNRSGFIEQVSNFVPSMGHVALCVDMLPKLKQIKETLDVLAEEKSSFNLREGVVNSSGSKSRKRTQTGSFVIESEVLGRVEDKEMIVDKLLSESPGKLSVISIVGIGGLGKTTLAQLAYNDERVAGYFDLKIWVCVNDDFDVGRIMVSILESGSKSKCDFFGMNVLQFRLEELLFEKRYLLVLDDVWNEDHNEWDNLRISLRSGMEGSKIIVTTRSEKVASIMGTTYIHQLKGLSGDNCWALFKQRAFGHNEDHHPNLLAIGKQIVKKCGGVPLAAKTLGSVMRFKREEKEWLFVQDSDLWDVSKGDNGILPALRLSYSHLPSHLKGCFAYCSIFPKNYIFKKEKLIQLWIAEGLIQSLEGRKSLEFIGNEYFNNLVWMSFFLDVQRGDHGSIVECKMHNLIHDLAQSVAGNEYLKLEDNNVVRSPSLIRHSSVVCDFRLSTIPEALFEAKKLRTLILVFPRGDLGEVPPGVFSSFRYLRVLDLSGSGIKKLHESISSFIFLRYLDLSNTHVETLPESVCCLSNLEVLNLSGCYNLIKLPSHTCKLFKLKHLIITGCERLTKMPASIGNLKYLRTLSMFIVGGGVGESLSELQSLNLGGELNIRHLENVKDATEAMTADMKGKRNLQSLELSWGNDRKELNRNNDIDGTLGLEVLNDLQPYEYLKKLSIKGYRGICFPGWMSVKKLPNLTELVLIDCRRCERLPTLGQLPFLKVLYLQGMNAVKDIGKEFYGEVRSFPSLKELTLTDFPNLEDWWAFSQREGFPSLVKLTVSKCVKLQTMPCFPLLKHLELRSCKDTILRSASNLTSLSIIVIEEFRERLVFLENLLQNNALLISLTIGSCPNLRTISPNIGNLINLKTLTVRWCEELLSLPQGLQNLTSLESLEIIECHSLISLPEDIQGLSSLRSLSIENCNNIASLPRGLQFLTALEHLAIMYCPKLESLPKDLQHLSTLKSLTILNCPELVSLPEGLQHVSTLQNLEVHGCPGLQSLPEWVANLTSLRSLALSDCHNLTSLPGGLQSLSSLQYLSIRECHALEERCRKDIGEDWPKINHIAHVYIGPLKFRQYDTVSSSSH
ncbi:putative disease resistance protein RGA3 isoform X1 [Fagus crenata]